MLKATFQKGKMIKNNDNINIKAVFQKAQAKKQHLFKGNNIQGRHPN